MIRLDGFDLGGGAKAVIWAISDHGRAMACAQAYSDGRASCQLFEWVGQRWQEAPGSISVGEDDPEEEAAAFFAETERAKLAALLDEEPGSGPCRR